MLKNNILNKNIFFIKEHRGILKAANSYDILDMETQTPLINCREVNLGTITKIFRFTKYKPNTPFEVELQDPNTGIAFLTLKRGVTIFRSVVSVFDSNNVEICRFRQKMLSFGGKFEVLDNENNNLLDVNGKWTSWEFNLSQNGTDVAKVTKKWAGIGRELFTTADNYVLKINDTVSQNDKIRPIILASVICIDMVLKEKSS